MADCAADRGFKLSFRKPKDESAELVKYGQAQYDHLIMFTPSTKCQLFLPYVESYSS